MYKDLEDIKRIVELSYYKDNWNGNGYPKAEEKSILLAMDIAKKFRLKLQSITLNKYGIVVLDWFGWNQRKLTICAEHILDQEQDISDALCAVKSYTCKSYTGLNEEEFFKSDNVDKLKNLSDWLYQR